MVRIVTGRFETLAAAEKAARALREARCNDRDIELFSSSPPGQHGSFPAGKGLGENEAQQRRWPAGVIVAVKPGNEVQERDVLRILREAGAEPLQTVEGEWRQGRGQDFDPVSAPQASAEQRFHVVYRIFPGGHGKWNVFEGDMGKLLSGFPDRQSAVDYATSIARTKKNAVVEIYRAGGVLESSRAYSQLRAASSPTVG